MARRFSSPNPPSSRPHINQHLKTPEHGFGVSGYRHPSDMPQRMSGGAKENDNRESRSLHRSRSPGKHSSVNKGNRNFMAPTISASSKVISSSFSSSASKRRILSERNEAPQIINRGSYSLISGSDSEICYGCQNFPDKEPDQIAPIASPPPPPELPIIAPLDADPSAAAAPPYDVERNFLSPRPQFLHYKPNPRIQLYLNNKQQHLFDQFPDESPSSESCDDVDEDVSSILSDSHDFLQEEKVAEPAEEEEEEEEEEEVEEEEEEETDTPVTNSRICNLHKPRILPVVFMMLAACFLFPAIDTPVIFRKESPLPSSPYPEFLSRITEFATSRLRTEEGNVGTFSIHYGFLNSTMVQEEQSFLGFPAALKESDADVEVAYYHEKEMQPENIDIPVEEEQDSKEVTEEASAKTLVEASDDPTTAEPNLGSELEPELEPELNSDHVEEEMEQQVHVEEEEDRSNSDGDSEVSFDEEDEAKTTPSTAATTTTLPTKSSVIVGVSSVIVALAAVLLSLYLFARNKKKEKEKEKEEMASSSPRTTTTTTTTTTLFVSDDNVFISDQTRQPDQSGSSMSISVHDQPFDDAVQKKTNDSGGGGGSPEMSSTTNYHETSIGGDSFSFERVGGSVGDSAASSASYGSFTTYEKLGAAKGRIKDEALTPVRRSSRIRSKVSSPILKT